MHPSIDLPISALIIEFLNVNRFLLNEDRKAFINCVIFVFDFPSKKNPVYKDKGNELVPICHFVTLRLHFLIGIILNRQHKTHFVYIK